MIDYKKFIRENIKSRKGPTGNMIYKYGDHEFVLSFNEEMGKYYSEPFTGFYDFQNECIYYTAQEFKILDTPGGAVRVTKRVIAYEVKIPNGMTGEALKKTMDRYKLKTGVGHLTRFETIILDQKKKKANKKKSTGERRTGSPTGNTRVEGISKKDVVIELHLKGFTPQMILEDMLGREVPIPTTLSSVRCFIATYKKGLINEIPEKKVEE